MLAARTSAATDERREHKRIKRFLAFDGQHLALHGRLLEVIRSARARYDAAPHEKALASARLSAARALKELEDGLITLDSKSVGSRLLADYRALHASLGTAYPDAKLASLRGDAAALEAESARFDRTLQAMSAWLEDVKKAQAAKP